MSHILLVKVDQDHYFSNILGKNTQSVQQVAMGWKPEESIHNSRQGQEIGMSHY